MSPTNFEYSAQFVPNWNSITMPVATPHHKSQAENLAEEFTGSNPVLVILAKPAQALGHNQQPRQSDCQWREEKVKSNSQPKLDA